MPSLVALAVLLAWGLASLCVMAWLLAQVS